MPTHRRWFIPQGVKTWRVCIGYQRISPVCWHDVLQGAASGELRSCRRGPGLLYSRYLAA